MTQPSQELPVKLALFVELEKYANAIVADQGVTEDSEDLIASEVMTFCQTFFQQFLRSAVGLEITGINDKAKLAAIRRRVALEKQEGSLPVRRLIYMFQDLCDMWPDISLGSYVPSESLYRQFYTSYMPQLLGRINDWAQAGHYPELVKSTTSAIAAFDAASALL